jgi:hypothetical protein
MSTIPQKLDWVTMRANCTVAKVFNELCDGIRDDVSAINSTKGLSENPFRADLHSNGTTIYVGQVNSLPRKIVAIGVVQDRIEVHQEWNGGERLAVTVGLNDEGRCVLRLEDMTELEQWQFRKRALESLFFSRQPI